MIRKIMAGLVLIGAMMVGAPAHADGGHHNHTIFANPDQIGLPKWATRPCKTEDSFNCYWNAGLGNGEGTSFYSIRVRRYSVCTFYVDSRNHWTCDDIMSYDDDSRGGAYVYRHARPWWI